MLINLIKSHAILHQASRDRSEKGMVVAETDDYAAVYALVANSFAEGLNAVVPAIIRETVEAVRKEQTDKGPHDGYTAPTVTVVEIAKALGLDKSTTLRRVHVAIDRGYLVNHEDRKGRPAQIVLGEPLPDEIEILPRPETL